MIPVLPGNEPSDDVMTGEKDRGTTHEKLWKLSDEQLSTPAHDELVIRLLDIKYVVDTFKEIKEIYSKPKAADDFRSYIGEPQEMELDCRQYAEKHVDRSITIKTWLTQNGVWPLRDCFRPVKSWEEHGVLELGFSSEYDRIRWFLKTKSGKEIISKAVEDEYCKRRDVIMKRQEKVISACNEYMSRFSYRDFIKISSEVPIFGYNSFIIGYWDVVIEFARSIELGDGVKVIFPAHEPYHIEVKPKISSFGQTLRQLKTYMSYQKGNASIILYTPDTRFKNAFESQGICVVSP